ncbi:GntR family transcriptional regulator [Streptomyces sp. NPDC005863]|uniref:GntR family transcriptional regulator n=1 Tax=Streptomyces sp. NPDC005863 TaxID=3364735 RepID=UPI0036D19643
MSIDLDRTRPIWRQVAAVIVERIEGGTYPAGSRVPSVVELSTEFGVAASTAQKVLAHLKAEGLVRAEIGLGTFVADR